jgi:hypothetical protein
MTDRNNRDLAALLTPAPSHGVQFSQAKVLTWDHERLRNTLEWRGITLTDVPIIEGINALTIQPNDIVGLLGWAPENAKGVGTWWILGKISNPGEFVADLNITAKLIRFLTEDGNTLAFFGKEGDGDPMWFFTYGTGEEIHALGITTTETGGGLTARYRDGGVAWRILGDTGSQFYGVYDEAGREIMSTDAASGTGLARPYLNIPMTPSSGTSVGTGGPFWPAFTNAAYQEVFHGWTTLWQPRIAIGVQQSVTSGTVEWQLRIDGVTAGSGSGGTDDIFDVPGWGTSIVPGSIHVLQLFARNTSGTQSRVNVDRCYGLQS